MPIYKAQNNFNAGEFSPRLYLRNDLPRHKNAVKTMKNMYSFKQGGATRRPGFKYVASCLYAAKKSRLIPFEFSTTQAYIIEFGDQKLQFFKDQGLIQTEDANTKLLLHFDGADASTTITDSGATGHTVTANGSAQLNTTTRHFTNATNSASCVFSTTSDFLSIPDHADWNFGATAFTIDFWVNFTSVLTGCQCLYAQDVAPNFVSLYQNFDKDKLVFSVVAAGIREVFQEASWSPSASTWYHVAIVRGWGGVANDWAITINGATITTFTDSSTLPNLAATAKIGRLAATSIIDEGPVGHALTVNGDTTISTAAYKFANSSVYFDGTGDYLSAPDSSSWDIVASNVDSWTISLWEKNAGVGGPFLAQYVDADNGWRLASDAGGDVVFRLRNAGVDDILLATSGTPVSGTAWHHIALVKVNANYALYIDGVRNGTATYSGSSTFAQALWVANANAYFNGYMADIHVSKSNIFSADPTSAANITVPTTPPSSTSDTKLLIYGDWKNFKGYLDEYRVSNTARWTAAFTPDTLPYPAQSGYTSYSLTTNVPYLESQLFDISYTQSADTMYLAHPSHEPRKLTRTDHDSWTMTTIDFSDGPWMPENTTATTMDPSATTGNINIVASTNTFVSTDVGRYITIKHGTTWGVALITAYTSATQVDATVKRTFGADTAQAAWKLGAWSDTTGWPSTVIFHENRLVFANSSTYPNAVWFSKIDSYEDFGYGVTSAGVEATIVDTDGLDTKLVSNQINAVAWMYSGDQLFVGTSGGEWVLEGDASTGITPTALRQTQKTKIGSENVKPVGISNALLFLQKVGKKIIYYQYQFESNSYVPEDISAQAEHFTRDNDIVEFAYQQEPDEIIWSVRDDGAMLGITLDRQNEIVAFHKHDTTGYFESVATIPGSDRHELWAVVRRTINGSTVRYVELMQANLSSDTNAQNAFYVDSGLTYSGVSTTTLSGLSHLEGATVAVLSGGAVVANKTVSSGAITVTATTNAVVGLPYTSEVETLPILLQDGYGDTTGRTIRNSRQAVRLYQTSDSFSIGRNSSNVETVSLKSYNNENSSLQVFTGQYDHLMNQGHEKEPKTYIKRADAAPLTILCITTETLVSER